jgi:purine-binding chemotaxis protein CheW
VDQASPRLDHPLVVFLTESKPFALHLSVVERVLPMVAFSPLSGGPEIVLGAINLHGRVVPVLDLRRRLGLPECEYGPEAHVLAARARQRVLALPVDEVTGVQRVVADAVTAPDEVAPGLALVNGVAPLEDGILVIHDLDAFLSSEEEVALDRALEGVEA